MSEKTKKANGTAKTYMELETMFKAIEDHLLELRQLRTANDELREENEDLRERLENNQQSERDELAFFISSQREARKMSLRQFAELIGTNSTTLKNYERAAGNLKEMALMAEKIKEMRANK